MPAALHPTSEYYLHKNGSLIYKPHGCGDTSGGLCLRVWNAVAIGKSPETFLAFLKDAKALGALPSEIKRLHDANDLSSSIPDATAQLGIL